MRVNSWTIVTGSCLTVLLALGAFKYSQIQAAIAFGASFPEPAESVEYAIAQSVEWQDKVTATGEVVAKNAVNLTNELAGRIIEVGFDGGQRVKKDQVLIRLDVSEELARRDAALAEVKLAGLSLQRNTSLVDQGVVSNEALDNAQAQYNAASAQVAALEAVILKKTIRAPFDASTGLHELRAGQYLAPGTIITRLIGVDSSVWIDFDLPQHQASTALGDVIEVVGDPNNRAVVVAKDSWVDSASRHVSYRAEASVDDDFLPGSFTRVRVPFGSPMSAVMLPASAIRYDSTGANVYVLVAAEIGADAPERASKRSVELGPEDNQAVIILKGVKAGERVAANGSFKLRENLLVNAVAPALSPIITAPIVK
ncbi:MAG: efflux RND transporter periplasmic adaptor subunit [Porticoccaceae bacterium]|nr:efflux RND transporter periplasmic adaptor subunit [Porticoccaceae bacterium]MDG1475437.1 efflux RND transporter periplasmic adaptor subunit [Porticoccaceae bacterium]